MMLMAAAVLSTLLFWLKRGVSQALPIGVKHAAIQRTPHLDTPSTLQTKSGFVYLLRRKHRNKRSIITALASALPMDGHVVFLHHEQGDAQIPAMAFFF